MSPGPSASSALRNCGRSERAPLSFSNRTGYAPAVFNASTWPSPFWPSVADAGIANDCHFGTSLALVICMQDIGMVTSVFPACSTCELLHKIGPRLQTPWDACFSCRSRSGWGRFYGRGVWQVGEIFRWHWWAGRHVFCQFVGYYVNKAYSMAATSVDDRSQISASRIEARIGILEPELTDLKRRLTNL